MNQQFDQFEFVNVVTRSLVVPCTDFRSHSFGPSGSPRDPCSQLPRFQRDQRSHVGRCQDAGLLPHGTTEDVPLR